MGQASAGVMAVAQDFSIKRVDRRVGAVGAELAEACTVGYCKVIDGWRGGAIKMTARGAGGERQLPV